MKIFYPLYIVILTVSCQMLEHEQEIKTDRYSAGDIVLNTGDFSADKFKLSVQACNAPNCDARTVIKHMFHSFQLVANTDNSGSSLSLDNVVFSFKKDPHVYTCSFASLPIKSFIRVYKESAGEHEDACYKQNEQEAYVQKLASYCTTKEGTFVPITYGDNNNKSGFACEHDKATVPLHCFADPEQGHTNTCIKENHAFKASNVTNENFKKLFDQVKSCSGSVAYKNVFSCNNSGELDYFMDLFTAGEQVNPDDGKDVSLSRIKIQTKCADDNCNGWKYQIKNIDNCMDVDMPKNKSSLFCSSFGGNENKLEKLDLTVKYKSSEIPIIIKKASELNEKSYCIEYNNAADGLVDIANDDTCSEVEGKVRIKITFSVDGQ